MLPVWVLKSTKAEDRKCKRVVLLSSNRSLQALKNGFNIPILFAQHFLCKHDWVVLQFIIILVHLGPYDSCSYITLHLHRYFIV